MRNLLALLGATVVTVVAVGWYLDWFRVHRGPADNGHQNYNLQLNTTKIGEDIHKGTNKVHDVIEKKVHEHQEPAKGEKSTQGEDAKPFRLTTLEKDPPGPPVPEGKGPEVVLPEGPPLESPPPPPPPQR